MPTLPSRLRMRLLAAAVPVFLVAAHASTAQAFSPTPTVAPPATPTPLPTASPTPYPLPSTQRECRTATAQTAGREIGYSVKPNGDASAAKITWTAPTGAVGTTTCMDVPAIWAVYVDGTQRGVATGGFTTTWTADLTEGGATKFEMRPVNNTEFGDYWSALTLEPDTCDGADPFPDFQDIAEPVFSPNGATWNALLTWTEPPRDCGMDVIFHRIYLDGAYVGQTWSSLDFLKTLDGLVPDSQHTVTIEAIDLGHNVVGTSERTFTVPGTPPPPTPTPEPTATPIPPTPTPLPIPTPTGGPGPDLCIDPAPGVTDPVQRVTNVTDRSATFSWTRFGCRQSLAGYVVVLNGTVVKSVAGPTSWAGSASLTGLYFNTTYNVSVIGRTYGGGTETVASGSFTTGPPDESGWFPTPTPTPSPSPVPTTTPAATATPTPLATPKPTPGATPGPVLCLDPWNITPVAPPNVDPYSSITNVTDGSARLQWARFGCRNSLLGYVIKLNGAQYRVVDRLTPWTATDELTGLSPSTKYTVEIIGNKGLGQTESIVTATFTTTAGPTPTPVTTPTNVPVARYAYTLQGTTTLATLTKGSMPLTGAVAATVDLPTGDVTADLQINDTQGRLTVLGFLPVTATVGFVSSGQTTGKLIDARLTTNSKVRIKVRSVKAFGAIPLAGGNQCQTKQLSDITLKSTGAFDPTGAGGTLAGTYRISDLNGCGIFGGIVSAAVAGDSNAISVKLTPKP